MKKNIDVVTLVSNHSGKKLIQTTNSNDLLISFIQPQFLFLFSKNILQTYVPGCFSIKIFFMLGKMWKLFPQILEN
jgi:hypothetical protein